MGCYDEVIITCPSCGEYHTEQTKWGDCMLRTYMLESAPLELVAAMKHYSDNDELYCEHCSEPIEIGVNFIVHTYKGGRAHGK